MIPKLNGRATATVTKGEPSPKPIKLYFALLNHGWLRSEFTTDQLPEMNKVPGVKLYWEHPKKTWTHPIYSNRNAITKRFLKTDCDFLIMQDDDIIPLHNPAELVFADKDIVGSPAKVRTSGGTIDWVAYIHHPTLDGYSAIDMGAAPSHADLLSVDIVGTGLICIKRKVLEGIIEKFPGVGPFTVENNEDGICEWGTDFAFCKRAKKCGFEVYTTPHRICEHVKEMGFLDMDGYDNSDFRCRDNDRYEMAWGDWAIQEKDWKFIKKTMEDFGVKNVLEFGAGLSSLLMSEKASVVSYETKDDWADKIKEKANGNGLFIVEWDGESPPEMVTQRGPFDMAFIDGPPAMQSGGPGREVSYATVAEIAPPLVITHDSGRREEMLWAKRYLQDKYNIAARNGNHRQSCILWQIKEA